VKIAYFSDTHGYHDYVELPPVDILICGGDISGTGLEHQVTDFFNWFNQQQALVKVLIAGNHDRSFDPEKNITGEKPEWLIKLLDEYKNSGRNYYLENESCEVEGLKIWGSPVTPSFGRHYWAFNKDRGVEIDEVWQQIPLDSDIVVTHGPALYYRDKLMDGQNVGCENLRNSIRYLAPILHLSGHIHFGYGYETDQLTYSVNGAICDESYNPINKPWIITIENKQVIKIENE
jgi:Icc-related predicted phosphoesterase